MADYFDRNNRNNGGNYRRDDSFDRGGNNGDNFDYNKDNSFDRRYSSQREQRSRGYFDRSNSSRRSDSFDSQLPPIEQKPQNVYRNTVQPNAPMSNPQALPNMQGMPVQGMPIQGMPMQNMAPSAQAGQNVFSISNVMLFSPTSYADVQTLIDHLKRHEPAIVDFSNVDSESGQRILDFLSGAIYALSGSMQRISGSIFLLTPSGVSKHPSDISKSMRTEGTK